MAPAGDGWVLAGLSGLRGGRGAVPMQERCLLLLGDPSPCCLAKRFLLLKVLPGCVFLWI